MPFSQILVFWIPKLIWICLQNGGGTIRPRGIFEADLSELCALPRGDTGKEESVRPSQALSYITVLYKWKHGTKICGRINWDNWGWSSTLGIEFKTCKLQLSTILASFWIQKCPKQNWDDSKSTWPTSFIWLICFSPKLCPVTLLKFHFIQILEHCAT